MEYTLLATLLLLWSSPGQGYFDNFQPAATTNCPCGWGTKERIVGGEVAEAHRYPLVAGLAMADGIPFCGATIITQRHALTAAHCTFDLKGKEKSLRLLVGAHDVMEAAADQLVPIRRAVKHEAYSSQGAEAHDISVLVLAKDLAFRNDVGPACLPNRRVALDNYNVRVLGWGMTAYKGSRSNLLREVDLRVVPYALCQRFYPNELQKERTQFCTFEWNKDSCQGDSGGPLIAIDPEINRYVLVGLVSFGRDCATDSPAVNTDIGYYLPWIKATVARTSRGLQTCSKVSSPFG